MDRRSQQTWLLGLMIIIASGGTAESEQPSAPMAAPNYGYFGSETHEASYQGFLDQIQPTYQVPCPNPVESQSVARAARKPKQSGTYGGYEFGWLQPRLTENVSAVVAGPLGNRATAYDLNFELTPRVWAGWEHDRCTGIRARYWRIDTEAPTQVRFPAAGATPISLTIIGAGNNLSRTATAGIGDAFTSDYHLEMWTIDLEATQRLRLNATELVGSFGLRYADTYQRAHGVVTDGTGSMTELVCQDLLFDGFGPTTSIELNRQLLSGGTIAEQLSFFATTRGSILLGEQQQDITYVTGGGATTIVDRWTHDTVLPIGAVVGGLELLTRRLGACQWMLRTGYRAEVWFSTGGPVESESNLGLHGVVFSLAGRW